MGRRAEFRRKQREKEKKGRIFNMTAEELKATLEKARKEERERVVEHIKKEVTADVLKLMLIIPVNVLVSDYWQKSARKRVPAFVEECMKLYQATCEGTVSMEECQALAEEYSGIKWEW